MIKAEEISYKLGTKEVLHDISWEVRPGENWVVFGLNGCGKTSLLSIISAYMGASKGTLSLFGEPVTKENRLELRKQIGFVSSSFFNRYYTGETVLDIVLSGKFGRLGVEPQVTSDDVRKAKHLLNDWGLKSKIQYPYDLLSQGQRQKVLIARALIASPKLLILDEPCTGMDILSKEKFLNHITDITKSEKIGLIYVSHNSEEFLPIFNKAMLLKNNTIHSQGEMKEIFSDENMSNFLEVPTQIAWFNDRPSIRVL